MASDWSSLPQDLVYSIIDRIPEFHDFLRFSSVCKTWRSTALLLPVDTIHQQNLELLKTYRNRLPMLYEVGGHSLYSVTGAIYNHIQLPHNSIPSYTFGTYNGWLFTILDIKNDSNLISLVNPLLNKSFHLPPIQSPLFPHPADYYHFYKALLLPMNPTSTSSHIRVEDRHTYHVVLLYLDIDRVALKLTCLKSGDVSWNMLDLPRLYVNDIDDIICYKGNLYALFYHGDVFNIDLTTGNYELVVDSPCDDRQMQPAEYRLMESHGGDLLLVSRGHGIGRNSMTRPRRYTKIEVYKMSWSSSSSLSWDRVRTIGEEALFLSVKTASFSVSTREFPMCKPNYIYYADGCFDISCFDDKPRLLDESREKILFGADLSPSMNSRRYIWILPYLKI